MHGGGMIGREAERDALGELLERAREGHGAMCVVEGEAGIGKSVLLHAAAENAASMGFQVFAGKAEELLHDVPFALLSAVLDLRADGLDARRADIARWLRSGHHHEDSVDDFSQLDFRVGEATVALVDELSVVAPLLLAVDDLQWADAASLRALARVAAIVPELPVMLLCGTRLGERAPAVGAFRTALARHGAATVTLDRLDDAEVVTLAERILGAPAGETLLARLAAAGGNPLFVSVAVDGLRASGELVERDGVMDVREMVAPTLSKTIVQRLRLCSAPTLDVLTFASVLGNEFTAGDLAALHGKPVAELLTAIREGMEASVLEERGDSLAFRHDLIRQALSAELPLTVRTSLHVEAARRLAAAGAPVTLTAPHLMRGVTRADPELLDLLHRTAVDAVRTAPDTALALLDRVVELAGTGTGRADATLGDRALALLQSARFEEFEAACRAALAKGVSASTAANLRLRLVQLLSSRGNPTQVLPEIEAALNDDTHALGDRAQFAANEAVVRLFGGDFDGATAAARRAVDDAERSGDRTAMIVAGNALAFAHRAAGRATEALEVAEQCADLAERDRTFDALRVVPHVMMAQALLDAGWVEDALASCRRGLRLAEEVADPDTLAWHHVSIGRCHALLGDWDAADTEFDIVRQLDGDAIGIRTSHLEMHTTLALVQRNDVMNARAHLDAALHAEAVIGAQIYPGMSARAQAVVAEAEGDPEGGYALVRDVWGLLAAVGARGELVELAWDLVRRSVEVRAEPAPDVVAAVEAIAADNPTLPRFRAIALACRGLSDGDADTLGAAVAAFEATDWKVDAAEVAFAAGETLLRAGRRDEGIAMLERALATFSGVGATRPAARAAAALRAAGIARGRRGTRGRPRTGWEALTETERTVARYVAERLSNPEIAERMYISRRTVQTHVSHALAKLGVSSRLELAAAAARNEGWALRIG